MISLGFHSSPGKRIFRRLVARHPIIREDHSIPMNLPARGTCLGSRARATRTMIHHCKFPREEHPPLYLVDIAIGFEPFAVRRSPFAVRSGQRSMPRDRCILCRTGRSATLTFTVIYDCRGAPRADVSPGRAAETRRKAEDSRNKSITRCV